MTRRESSGCAGRQLAGSLSLREVCCPEQIEPLIRRIHKSVAHRLKTKSRCAASVLAESCWATPYYLLSAFYVRGMLCSGMVTIHNLYIPELHGTGCLTCWKYGVHVRCDRSSKTIVFSPTRICILTLGRMSVLPATKMKRREAMS